MLMDNQKQAEIYSYKVCRFRAAAETKYRDLNRNLGSDSPNYTDDKGIEKFRNELPLFNKN
jgi:hypothetical protein